MKELTTEEQEILRQGQLAEAALSSPAVASAINELSEYLTNSILGTAPSDLSLRESYYHQHKALADLTAILKNRVSMKQHLEAMLTDEENEPNA